ncbi:MAG: hypothetical protein NC911_09580 [Candidatus Omnitrophica bacterium]|nr:hypothetical protein [Candidatus Omnitrophota bacterium]MCM8769893.1 hypothetical protein [Candidatus Omnitrophota bacterium]
MDMKVVKIRCEKEEVKERIRRITLNGYLSSHCHHNFTQETELPLSRPGDYEARLLSGFKFFEMPENGYPAD